MGRFSMRIAICHPASTAVNDNGTLTPGPAVSVAEDYAYSVGNSINIHGDVCGIAERMPFLAPAGQTAQLLPVPRYTN